MAYLDELMRQVMITPPVGAELGLPKGAAYSSYYPTYEVQTPQYIVPNAYSLAQVGYRTNEVIYALISKRAKAMSEAPLWVYKDEAEYPEEMSDHPIRKLLKRANRGIGEKMFWQITSIYRDIAGFCAWEIERNNLNEPIKMWPMRPDWCSFLRGEQKPLRAIRYQPYGLPPADIPVENLFIVGNFDPLWPMLKFYSPTMNALESINVDNSMTDFLLDFVKHGAKFSGLLSVAQTIDENTALDYKRRFRDSHGGTQNWSDPLVLGLGAKYESMQMNFRDMAFPELDARTESRICMSFEMSPILISAKVGLDRSTYSNYEQANKAWYNEWVSPEWQIVADGFGEQMLPFYHEDTENYFCSFDTTDVRALNEDRSVMADRASKMYKDGLAKLNEAREEMGLDPVEGEEGEQFYKAPQIAVNEQQQAMMDKQNSIDPKNKDKSPAPKVRTADEVKLQDEERKDFRAFAKRRIKENKHTDILEFEFKYIEEEEGKTLIEQYARFDTGADKVLEGIKQAIGALEPAQTEPQAINIQVHSYPTEAPVVNIENKASDVTTPAPIVTVVNKVEPTAIKVDNVTNVPEVKRSSKKAKLTKNGDGTIFIEEV